MISVVAARYAKALADVVTAGVHASSAAQADPAAITAQLRAVDEMIETSNELKNALASPAVAPSRKRAVMARLIAPMNLSAQVRNFLFVVIDHRRVHQLKSIIEAFENLADERLGYVRADVRARRLCRRRSARLWKCSFRGWRGRKPGCGTPPIRRWSAAWWLKWAPPFMMAASVVSWSGCG